MMGNARKILVLLATLLALSLQMLACKSSSEESKLSHSEESVADARRKLMEKIILNYLKRLREARIEQVIDPYYDQGELQVKAMSGELFSYPTFTQVRWNRVQADKLEVLRCKLLNDSEKSCPNVRDLEFADLEKQAIANACGYEECKRVREQIDAGTKLIDRSIVTSINPDKATSFHYLVRPCFENYLLIGKGTSKTLVKCGDEEVKNSNSAAPSNRYLVRRACGEAALLICGKSSLSATYTRQQGTLHIATDLFDQRERIIKQLEELSMEMARAAQHGMKESLLAKDMSYEDRLMEARMALENLGGEYATEHKELCEGRIKARSEREWYEMAEVWQAVAAAPFGMFSKESPDCDQAKDRAEAAYVNDTMARLGEDAISDAGIKSARSQGYIDCSLDHVNTLLAYRKKAKKDGLTAFDANMITDVGIAMIPMPKSELNSRSTAQAVQMSLHYLTGGDQQACDPFDCPRCLKHMLKLRTYNQQQSNLISELRAINVRINAELTRKGIKDPYAEVK